MKNKDVHEHKFRDLVNLLDNSIDVKFYSVRAVVRELV